jgi:hypothetical protein
MTNIILMSFVLKTRMCVLMAKIMILDWGQQADALIEDQTTLRAALKRSSSALSSPISKSRK